MGMAEPVGRRNGRGATVAAASQGDRRTRRQKVAPAGLCSVQRSAGAYGPGASGARVWAQRLVPLSLEPGLLPVSVDVDVLPLVLPAGVVALGSFGFEVPDP